MCKTPDSASPAGAAQDMKYSKHMGHRAGTQEGRRACFSVPSRVCRGHIKQASDLRTFLYVRCTSTEVTKQEERGDVPKRLRAKETL